MHLFSRLHVNAYAGITAGTRNEVARLTFQGMVKVMAQ